MLLHNRDIVPPINYKLHYLINVALLFHGIDHKIPLVKHPSNLLDAFHLHFTFLWPPISSFHLSAMFVHEHINTESFLHYAGDTSWLILPNTWIITVTGTSLICRHSPDLTFTFMSKPSQNQAKLVYSTAKGIVHSVWAQRHPIRTVFKQSTPIKTQNIKLTFLHAIIL